MNCSSAYFLVSHGSRDLRPQQAAERLAQAVEEQVGCTNLIATGVLELAPLSLHQQIEQFAEVVLANGCQSLQILPLFLLPGVHVMEDIPTEVAIAQANVGSQITIDLKPYLGSHTRIAELLPTNDLPANAAKLLLSHGSRRIGAHQHIDAIASQIGAIPVYWSTSPNWETQIATLAAAGWQQIVIIPYFLFEGGLTDAIAQRVEQLALSFPHLSLQLEKPVGLSPNLVELVLNLLNGH
ncbi:MAG: sirohydrochlorin chelatase [Leptolyngbyaceae cyanobacterium SL_7_1]|nr:sirohydrochlorin chelatase [Leptolyngbyaceae cyanobacterium SL_7_1]